MEDISNSARPKRRSLPTCARTAIALCAVFLAVAACGGSAGPEVIDSELPDGASGGGGGSAKSPTPQHGGSIDDASSDEDAARPDDGGVPEAGVQDPCPPKLDIDCSASCGGPTECFRVNSCTPGSSIVVQDAEFPFVVRTPAAPGSLTQSSRCEQMCGALPTFYTLAFRITTTHQRLRVRVEPPWRVANKTSASAACGWLQRSCESMVPAMASISVPIVVGTDDPNAPARNVIIEATSDFCPGDPS